MVAPVSGRSVLGSLWVANVKNENGNDCFGLSPLLDEVL